MSKKRQIQQELEKLLTSTILDEDHNDDLTLIDGHEPDHSACLLQLPGETSDHDAEGFSELRGCAGVGWL